MEFRGRSSEGIWYTTSMSPMCGFIFHCHHALQQLRHREQGMGQDRYPSPFIDICLFLGFIDNGFVFLVWSTE